MEDGLLVEASGRACALLELPVVNYPHLTRTDKVRFAARAAAFADRVGRDFSVHRVARREQGYDLPVVFLTVTLDPPRRGVLRELDGARRRFESAMGWGVRALSDGTLDDLRRDVRSTVRYASGCFAGARVASVLDAQWLLRRAPLRGTAVEPQLEVNGTSPKPHLLAALEECKEGGGAAVRCAADEGESVQAVLVMGAVPDLAEFPGPRSELMFAPLDRLDFQVDAIFRATVIPPDRALSRIRGRARVAATEWEEESTSGEPALRRAQAVNLARERQAQLEANPEPEVQAQVLLVVGANDGDVLRDRVQALRAAYGDIRLYRQPGLQRRLWWDALPSPKPPQVDDYSESFTTEQFSALAPTGGRACGGSSGPYIGYTVSGAGSPASPVLLDLAQAAQDDLPTAILCAGVMGSGKTLGSLWLAYRALEAGSHVMTVDPRPDHRIAELPEFVDDSEIVELVAGDEAQRGVLDPMRHWIPGMREELATSYLLEVLPPDIPGSWELSITGAVSDEIEEQSKPDGTFPSLTAVVDRLLASDQQDAHQAGEALAIIRRSGLGGLAFGRPGVFRDFERRRVRTIRTQGLELPPEGAARESYTRGERIGVATLRLVAARAMEAVCFDRAQHKVVVLDEGWTFLGSPQGRALLDRLIRLGRGYNATVIVATQTLSELGSLEELFGVRFAFGQQSRPAAERALHTLRGEADDDDRLIADLQGFRRGRCLMRDLDSRIAEVQVDLPPHLVKAFSTTPGQPVRA